jgi:5,10-methylenetetrahydromethanopterin reductase
VQPEKTTEEYRRIGRAAEAGGFDVVTAFQDLGFPPAIVPLTILALATERVRLGFAALNPYTLHPFEIAGQAATLDRTSNGRAFVGIVQGAWLDELGLHEPRPLAALKDAVEIVRRVTSGDTSGYEGERFRIAPGRGLAYELARPRIPIMVGTWKPRTAAYAGTIADEVKIGGCANPDMVRAMRGWIGNDRVGITVGAVTVVDEDGDAARALAARVAELYLPIVARLDATLELRAGAPLPIDRFVFAGTPDEVAAHARRMYEAGARRVEFGPPQGLTTESGIRLLAERVLPQLR